MSRRGAGVLSFLFIDADDAELFRRCRTCGDGKLIRVARNGGVSFIANALRRHMGHRLVVPHELSLGELVRIKLGWL